MANQIPPEELADLQARINSNPELQQALQQYQRLMSQGGPLSGGVGTNPEFMRVGQALQAAFQNAGIELPHDYSIDSGGQVSQESFWERNGWIAQVAALAAPVAGAFALPALAGGGGAAAGGGAAGGAAAAGGGAAAGTTAAGVLGTAGSILGAAAPILGGMAGANQEERILGNQQALSRDQTALNRYSVNEKLPSSRLSTSTRASMIANRQPVKANWGGPGSGLRGETVKYTGGFSNPNLIDPRTSQQANDVLDQQLQLQLNRDAPPALSTPAQESTGDQLLGGLTTGASILGGVQAQRKRRSLGQPYDYEYELDPNSQD